MSPPRAAGSLNGWARRFVALWRPSLVAYATLLGAFLIVPAGVVVLRAFDGVTGERSPIIEAVSGQYLGSFWYSIRLSALTAVLGSIIGTGVAAVLVDLPEGSRSRQVMTGYSVVAANMGGIPLAFAFLSAFGVQGLVTKLLGTAGFDLIGNGFRITNFSGIALVYMYFQIPLMTLVMIPAFVGLRRQWRDAVSSLGGTHADYVRRVILPVVTPSYVGGLLLLFANAFAAYATAFALSAGASRLVPVQIRFFLQGDTITGKTNLGYAMAAWMIIVMAVIIVVVRMLAARTEKWQ